MAVLFRRLTEHMQRFDGLFSSALLKSKILYITQGYLHFNHPVLHKYLSLQFLLNGVYFQLTHLRGFEANLLLDRFFSKFKRVVPMHVSVHI